MRTFFAFVLLCGFLFNASASNLPDLGEIGVDDLSPAQERQIGEEIMREVRRDPAWLDDPETEEYINRLGQRLVAASGESGRAFEFFVVRNAMLNAFALPGGYIGVHSGLILAAQSESELAGVLGHEIGHVTQRHIAQLIGKQKQATVVMLASILAAIAARDSRMSEAAIAAGAAGASQAQLAYSRDFEREADRVGLQTLEAAGFDARGMAGFFERLQRAARLYENNAPAYLRTHPLTTERIADMENRVMSMRYRQVADSPDFGYVRARLRVQSLSASEAIRTFTGLVTGSPDDPAARYGLALAQLRVGHLDEAARTLDELRRRAKPSPFIAILAGELSTARRDTDTAVNTLMAATKAFPESMSTVYALANAQIVGGRAQDAERSVRRALAGRSGDIRLWGLLSRANATLGKRTAQHRAQAEVYVLRGTYRAAVEQLELARRAGDGDFYELSAVDARLREVRTLADEERRAEQRRKSGR
ncbi:MAG: M48 family metalloprotease [Betaproteobacteria bacterium]|nr:M48 family metalloprotease [Betaproteobacteria bacterium]